MTQQEKLLKDYSDNEKGAYISAIASIATADRTASEEELEFLETLADSAELSPGQKMNIKNAALNETGNDLKAHLEILKNSELKYSLLTDLVAFAEADQEYSPEEKANVERIAWYLEIKPEQYTTINQYVQNVALADTSETAPQGFPGMEEKFKNSGLNLGSITKGLLGVIGPLLLSRLVSGGRRQGYGGLGGMLGGMNGGVSGGPGSILGSGGLGSIIGMINGGRGMSGAGNLLGKVLGGGF
jgi:uncharacterized tellurite resistance protein B-like protein